MVDYERSSAERRGKAKQRAVKLPGETRHQSSMESAATIARQIQLRKLESRSK